MFDAQWRVNLTTHFLLSGSVNAMLVRHSLALKNMFKQAICASTKVWLSLILTNQSKLNTSPWKPS